MGSNDYGQMQVSELRKALRQAHPVTRGMFSAEASKDECLAILRDGDDPVAVMRKHMADKAAAVATPDSGDDTGPEAGVVAEDDDAAEVALEAAALALGADADEFNPSDLNELASMGRFAQNQRWTDIAEQAKAVLIAKMDAVNRLQVELEAAKQAAQAYRPEAGTDVEATGDTVSIGGEKFPVVLAAGSPELAGMAEPDPGFRFKSWKSRLQCGATRFEHSAADVLRSIIDGDRVLLSGPPGTGKTQMVMQAAARMRWPLSRFNGNRDVTMADFVGCYEARNGSTVWTDGPLPRAMREGRILILDEFDHMPSECSSIMHSVMERNGSLTITAKGGEVVQPHANFRIVATANTLGFGDEHGQHPAAQVQDAAMRSRFDVVYHVGYLEAGDEAELLVAHSGISNKDAEAIVRIASDSREAVDNGDLTHAVSLRETMAWARQAKRSSLVAAMAVTVLGKMPDADRAAMSEIAQRHLGDLTGGDPTET